MKPAAASRKYRSGFTHRCSLLVDSFSENIAENVSTSLSVLSWRPIALFNAPHDGIADAFSGALIVAPASSSVTLCRTAASMRNWLPRRS